MTSEVDPIRWTTPSSRAGAGRAAGWRCPPGRSGPQTPLGGDRRTERHCYWPDHCSRPSHPHAQPLRSAQAPEGPERSGGGAKRLAAARNARATLLGDGLGPARSSPNHPSRPIATHPSDGRPRAHQDPPYLPVSHCPESEVQLSSLPSCKKVESPSRPRTSSRSAVQLPAIVRSPSKPPSTAPLPSPLPPRSPPRSASATPRSGGGGPWWGRPASPAGHRPR